MRRGQRSLHWATPYRPSKARFSADCSLARVRGIRQSFFCVPLLASCGCWLGGAPWGPRARHSVPHGRSLKRPHGPRPTPHAHAHAPRPTPRAPRRHGPTPTPHATPRDPSRHGPRPTALSPTAHASTPQADAHAARTHASTNVQSLLAEDGVRSTPCHPSSSTTLSPKAVSEATIAAGLAHLKYNARHWLELASADARANGADANTELCSPRWGEKFLQEFKAGRFDICNATVDTPSPVSRVECYPYQYHYGTTCTSQNMIMTDSDMFMGSHPSGNNSPIDDHKSYMSSGGFGSVRMDCQTRLTQADGLAEQAEMAVNSEQLPWFKQAYRRASSVEVQEGCDGGLGTLVVPHPVLFLTRVDPTNPFHHMESLVHLLISLEVGMSDSAVWGNTGPDAMQLVLADHFEEGPLMEVWRRISAPYPVLHLGRSRLPGPTCFKRSLHSHYVHPSWSITGFGAQVQQPTDCVSAIMLAASHWHRFLFLELLPEPDRLFYIPKHLQQEAAAATHAAGVAQGELSALSELRPVKSQIPPRPIQLYVLLASRWWFERALEAGGGLSPFQRDRAGNVTAKEVGATAALQEAVYEWNRLACVDPTYGWWQLEAGAPLPPRVAPRNCTRSKVSFALRVAEFSLLESSEDVAHMLSRTGVLFGVHGAALTNLWLMKPFHGSVVEVLYAPNNHFYNMATHLGHYHQYVEENYDDFDLKEAVTKAMDNVASKY
eukprot:gene17575-23900_t